MDKIVFFDTEVSGDGAKLYDIGAVKDESTKLHTGICAQFLEFIQEAQYLCGHNIFAHDLKYIKDEIDTTGNTYQYVDTLLLSPLLFPKEKHHYLGKEEKFNEEEENNPLNDAIKARDRFYEEVTAFHALPDKLKKIYYVLLGTNEYYKAFFNFLDYQAEDEKLETDIRELFDNRICTNSDLDDLIHSYPEELAYCLALIHADDEYADLCPWLTENFPDIRLVMQFLRSIPCKEGCRYCRRALSIHAALKNYFGYTEFRTYEGEPLQEKAVQAAVDGNSVLAVFPTGGGKSLTFQLPALMAGTSVKGLTVVISPLQSLMKDQVDNLEEKGITAAVTINGLLNPIERQSAIKRIRDCSASLLYIAPESLRSRTVERLLMERNVVRFVIDEAHCFSSWGQDFRVDYLYIGDFIKKLAKKKKLESPIPVSCFTATAKPKVISDIREYFRERCGVELSLFTTTATRRNLRYEVLYRENDEKKYTSLRALVEAKKCPAIVYVTRTKRAEELAERLTRDGFPALPFHGKMESLEKIENQNAFMSGEVNIIVATSAFGMGVDKDNVGLVVHYNISNSLEDYVQEAGRAGRNPALKAECYVLFNDDDIDKHFMMLSQTKLSMNEIQQVWSAVKRLSKHMPRLTYSALEIAREAGWNDSSKDVETKVKSAVAALENAGYLIREDNVPRVYANGILPHSMVEASEKIQNATNMTPEEKKLAPYVMSQLFGYKNRYRQKGNGGENRVDTLADEMGVERRQLASIIQKLREIEVLSDSKDMSAHIDQSDKQSRSETILARTAALERYLITNLPESGTFSYKQICNDAIQDGIKSATVNEIRLILNYWQSLKLIKRVGGGSNQIKFVRQFDPDEMLAQFDHRLDIAYLIMAELYSQVTETTHSAGVVFSVKQLLDAYNQRAQGNLINQQFVATSEDIEATLLYLHKIKAMKLEGGFLVFYQALQLRRVEMNNKILYKKSDYRQLEDFYRQRIQQIHIVEEYAHMMTKNYDTAQRFVQDYFSMDYARFIKKYFGNDGVISIGITKKKYSELFGKLSRRQKEIIQDDTSQHIVVAAGPGSGKTMVLVHKLASLLILENVKSEQLLMLTFSRAAAMEFKSRLIDLIGETAYFVEVNTFHSYSFDLLGRIGTLAESDDVVRRAAELIRQGNGDMFKITKTVLVLDEAQDMDADEFSLVTALMEINPEMRVIAVGDDDQNIYQFRGSDSKYFRSFITEYHAKQYDLTENYRSVPEVVALANEFSKTIKERMKTDELKSVRRESGSCLITHFDTVNLESATVQMFSNTYHSGSCCILTAKNEEAARMVAELKGLGYRARLIQDLSGFNLSALREIRSFLHNLGTQEEMPVIPDDRWDWAVKRLKEDFRLSSCLPECLKLLNDFDKTNDVKYRSDLDQYIYDTKFEDLVTNPDKTIFVSTIHKSKGREFNTVYMNLNQYEIKDDEQRHALYVGMTRARNMLYINENNGLFDDLNARGTKRRQNKEIFDQNSEILLPLTHEDIWLDYCLGRQYNIQLLHSGTELTLDTDYTMYAMTDGYRRPVLRLSRKMISVLSKYFHDGYRFAHSEIRFLVYWHPQDKPEKEGLIVLPDIYLKKMQ